MSSAPYSGLLDGLRQRFEANSVRHPNIAWASVLERLTSNSAALATVEAMEASGGEPDVVSLGSEGNQLSFVDCSPETPAGRRSLCYDRRARLSRKTVAPLDSAVEAAARLGASLLTEAQYFALQALGEFDTRTSSWLATPDDLRRHGGALFGDRRFGRVFVYHNGAASYYAARGFRACLVI